MVRGLSEPSQRPHFKATIVHKPLQARYKQLPGGGSLCATNLDHQKLGRATRLASTLATSFSSVRKGRSPAKLGPRPSELRERLAVVRSVVPGLVSEVAAAESSRFFCFRVLTVEKPTGSEVVDLLVREELLVRDQGFLGTVLGNAKAFENAFRRSIAQHRLFQQKGVP